MLLLPVFYSNRSAAYLQKGDADSALKDAESCIAAKPDWAKGYNRKGCAQHALKQYDEAIATTRKQHLDRLAKRPRLNAELFQLVSFLPIPGDEQFMRFWKQP